MSFFEKPKILLKKHYIITSSASACAISVALPLWYSLYIAKWSRADHYAVVYKSVVGGRNNGRKVGEVILVNSCIVGFWGCFEKGCGSRKDRFYYF
jgi:hypothetical protein